MDNAFGEALMIISENMNTIAAQLSGYKTKLVDEYEFNSVIAEQMCLQLHACLVHVLFVGPPSGG